ncbi:MAG: hypothetical protein HYX27_13445 [Acidobacteria bacterium]|nr:hypothetical protein [Acidobacteriota bacterium]
MSKKSATTIQVPKDLAGIRAAIAVLAGANLSASDRLLALQAIQACSFSSLDYNAARPDYLTALRQVATGSDANLRKRALGVLSRENDKFAQQLLVDGLRDPSKAAVPPEKALQLLTYNAHAGAYPVAREIVKNPPSAAAKREAIRLLASDPQSAKLIEETLADKKESVEVRRLSANALHTLHPERLQRWAAKAVADKTENKEMVAASLTALHQFGSNESIAGDKALRSSVAKLATDAPGKVKQLAKQFNKKYGL